MAQTDTTIRDVRQPSTHRLETVVPLAESVGAELGLGWFTRRSVFVSPAADVLQRNRCINI